MLKAMKKAQRKSYYEFGDFRIDVSERLLFNEQGIVPLTPKAFDTLLVLVENSGHVLSKEELMARVWPDSFVEENNLAQNISMLRKALGEEAGGRKVIETLPKRGYRFVALVRECLESEDEDEDEIQRTLATIDLTPPAVPNFDLAIAG